MDFVFNCKFGSHLYGTNTPTSDKDFKSLFLPSGYDIVMGRTKSTISNNTKNNNWTKNSLNDVDHEFISLRKFFEMLQCGDMIATELLFIPDNCILHSTKLYQYLIKNKTKLLNREVEGFVGYMRKQAAKYGIKGSRMSVTKKALDLVKTWNQNSKLSEFHEHIENFNAQMLAECGFDLSKMHSAIIGIPQVSGEELKHWEVCNKKMPYSASVANAKDILQRHFNIFGERTKQAEKNEGVDFKAVAHAIRVGRQTKELLTTGHITFPRSDAENLIEIKTGKIPYKAAATILESLLDDVEFLSKNSTILPEKCDIDFMEETLYNVYKSQVTGIKLNYV